MEKIKFRDGFDADLVKRSALLKNWIDRIDPTWVLGDCTVMSADIWPTGRLGFIEVDVSYSIGDIEHREHIILVGQSANIVVLIKCDDDGAIYTVLVQQPRIASGQLTFEYPGGMTDDSPDYADAAVRELAEECGIELNREEVFDTRQLLKDDAEFTIYNERLDERTACFGAKKKMTRAEIRALEGRDGGIDEDEQIVVKIVPFSDVAFFTSDCATLASTYTILALIDQGRIDLSFD